MFMRKMACQCIFLLFALAPGINSQLSESKLIEMHLPSSVPIEGHEVYVKEGSDLKVTCSVNDVAGWNSSQIYFFVSHNNDYVPRQNHVTIYNLSTAALSIEGLMIDEFSGRHEVICCLDLPKCSPLDSIFYNKDKVVYYDLKIGRKPLEANISESSCVVENYKYLFCSWTPNYMEQEIYTHLGGTKYHVDSSITWKIFQNRLMVQTANETVGNKNNYTWKADSGFSYDPAFVYKVQVSTTNVFGTVYSDWQEIQLKNIVRPGAATNININKHSGDQVGLNWEMPYEDKLITSIITYRSKWEPVKTLKVMEGVAATALPVLPNTVYELNITLRVGYEGPTNSFPFKSDPTPPKYNPELSPLGFEIIREHRDCKVYYDEEHCLLTPNLGCDSADTSDDCAYVILHWKAVNESHYCGEDFNYKLVKSVDPMALHSETKVVATISRDLTYVVMPVSRSEPLKLSVVSYNKEGESPGYIEYMSIPSADKIMAGELNPKVFVKQNNHVGHKLRNDVKVTWDPVSRDVGDRVTYVVFWCKRYTSKQICKENLDWSVATSNTSLAIQIDGSHDEYIFGVAINNVSYQQRIQWSKCRYVDTAKPSIPTLEMAPNQEADSISFDVKVTDCFVTTFKVYFCDGKDCSWKHNIFNRTYEGSYYVLDDLRGGVPYRIKVEAVSFSGVVSSFSIEEALIVKKHWATGAAIFGVTLAVLVGVFFFGAGLYFLVVKPRRFHRQLKERTPAPVLPTKVSPVNQEPRLLKYSDISTESGIEADLGRLSSHRSSNGSVFTVEFTNPPARHRDLSPTKSGQVDILPGIREDPSSQPGSPRESGMNSAGYIPTGKGVNTFAVKDTGVEPTGYSNDGYIPMTSLQYDANDEFQFDDSKNGGMGSVFGDSMSSDIRLDLKETDPLTNGYVEHGSITSQNAEGNGNSPPYDVQSNIHKRPNLSPNGYVSNDSVFVDPPNSVSPCEDTTPYNYALSVSENQEDCERPNISTAPKSLTEDHNISGYVAVSVQKVNGCEDVDPAKIDNPVVESGPDSIGTLHLTENDNSFITPDLSKAMTFANDDDDRRINVEPIINHQYLTQRQISSPETSPLFDSSSQYLTQGSWSPSQSSPTYLTMDKATPNIYISNPTSSNGIPDTHEYITTGGANAIDNEYITTDAMNVRDNDNTNPDSSDQIPANYINVPEVVSPWLEPREDFSNMNENEPCEHEDISGIGERNSQNVSYYESMSPDYINNPEFEMSAFDSSEADEGISGYNNGSCNFNEYVKKPVNELPDYLDMTSVAPYQNVAPCNRSAGNLLNEYDADR